MPLGFVYLTENLVMIAMAVWIRLATFGLAVGTTPSWAGKGSDRPDAGRMGRLSGSTPHACDHQHSRESLGERKM